MATPRMRPRWILAGLGLVLVSVLLITESIPDMMGIAIIVGILAAVGVFEQRLGILPGGRNIDAGGGGEPGDDGSGKGGGEGE